jgi:hypothetical protein
MALDRLGQPKWVQWIKGESEDFSRLGGSGDPEAVEPLLSAQKRTAPSFWGPDGGGSTWT